MKYILSINILLLLTKLLVAQTQDTVKVLFVGNSFTYYNDLPGMFSQLAAGAGKSVIVASHTPGGMSVGDTVQGTSAHMNNPLVYNLIRSNDWDYFVLQDNQGRFVRGYGIFPASSLVIEGHIKLRDSLLFYHPCAKMLWFAGWGPKAGYPPYAYSGTALIDSIYNNYLFLKDTAGQIIAPIGPAWERIVNNYPAINLWDTDDVHPGPLGTSLTADILYSTIFKSNSLNSNYTATGITAGIDSILKQTAFETVSDSINNSGLLIITPTINSNGNILSINGYQSYDWYLNGNYLNSNSGTLTATQNGNYSAIAYDANNCGYLASPYILTGITATNSIYGSTQNIHIYPNPCNSFIKIEATETLKEIQLLTIEGKILFNIDNVQSTTISTSKLADGIYLIKTTDKNHSKSFHKIIVNQ